MCVFRVIFLRIGLTCTAPQDIESLETRNPTCPTFSLMPVSITVQTDPAMPLSQTQRPALKLQQGMGNSVSQFTVPPSQGATGAQEESCFSPSATTGKEAFSPRINKLFKSAALISTSTHISQQQHHSHQLSPPKKSASPSSPFLFRRRGVELTALPPFRKAGQ